MRITMLLLIAIGAACLAGCASRSTPSETMSADFTYFCTCDTCGCKTMSTKPGMCGCGHELKRKKVLKSDTRNVYICECPADCVCSADPSGEKCGCGKPLVPFPVDSAYECVSDDGACVMKSNKPGTCGCGQELQKK